MAVSSQSKFVALSAVDYTTTDGKLVRAKTTDVIANAVERDLLDMIDMGCVIEVTGPQLDAIKTLASMSDKERESVKVALKL